MFLLKIDLCCNLGEGGPLGITLGEQHPSQENEGVYCV